MRLLDERDRRHSGKITNGLSDAPAHELSIAELALIADVPGGPAARAGMRKASFHPLDHAEREGADDLDVAMPSLAQ
jgi:hypothetical protein